MRTDSPWAGLKAQLPTAKLGGEVVVMVYSPDPHQGVVVVHQQRLGLLGSTASGTRFAICTMVA